MEGAKCKKREKDIGVQKPIVSEFTFKTHGGRLYRRNADRLYVKFEKSKALKMFLFIENKDNRFWCHR